MEYYTLKDMAATLGIRRSHLRYAIMHGQIVGVVHIPVGSGCKPRFFTKNEWNNIKRWWLNRPKKLMPKMDESSCHNQKD